MNLESNTTEKSLLEPEFSNVRVKGEIFTKIPKDLYIPPDALRVFLESFEGPLDLLLYLIKRDNINILDIPIAEVTRQYMEYIELINELRLELAAEYLVMAAMLIEIKSRLLLPQVSEVSAEEEDPRAELARRLQEYERYKKAAEDLDSLPRRGRDTFAARAETAFSRADKPKPEIDMNELLMALAAVLKRATLRGIHHISREPLSVRERMTKILEKLKNATDFIAFYDCFDLEERRAGVVVTFIAMLELLRESIIDIVQSAPFAPIYIKLSSDESSIQEIGQ